MAESLQSTLLRKTATGVAALRDRAPSLTQRSRMALIMVDGVKSVAELTRYSPDPVRAIQTLSELLAAEFVEISTPTDKIQANANQPVSTDVAVAIRRTVKLLENLLGPSSEPLCIQLEKCRTQSEFESKVADMRRVIAGMHNDKKADEFLAAALGQ